MASTAFSSSPRLRVGIVGYGSVGQYFVDRILNDPAVSAKLELAFVWNRTASKIPVEGTGAVPTGLILTDLNDFASRKADMIVELSHPSIAKNHGEAFVSSGSDFFVGSPTAFADPEADAILRKAAGSGSRSVYVPVGALWGATDLARMASQGTLKELQITMKKHPLSLKLDGELETKRKAVETAEGGEHVLYSGPVRQLAALAPNNVNTMAAACIACPSLGFDGVVGRLVSDTSLDSHVIEIDARGAKKPDGTQFRCLTSRINPAPPGAVTGAATYASFLASLMAAADDAVVRRRLNDEKAAGRVMVC